MSSSSAARWTAVGKDVVRGLAHVHVVVRVDVVAGERCHDLVRVHVRGRSRPGLEDVERELIVELARADAVAGGGDAFGLLLVQQAQLCVHARGGGLDPAEPARDGRRNRLAGDGEVVDRLAGFRPPELLPLFDAHGSSLLPRRRLRAGSLSTSVESDHWSIAPTSGSERSHSSSTCARHASAKRPDPITRNGRAWKRRTVGSISSVRPSALWRRATASNASTRRLLARVELVRGRLRARAAGRPPRGVEPVRRPMPNHFE